jgi:hypothetical protein
MVVGERFSINDVRKVFSPACSDQDLPATTCMCFLTRHSPDDSLTEVETERTLRFDIVFHPVAKCAHAVSVIAVLPAILIAAWKSGVDNAPLPDQRNCSGRARPPRYFDSGRPTLNFPCRTYAETLATTIRAVCGLSRQTPSARMTKSAGSKT